ncbi:MAG: SDR family oxidoreductase [Actinomycetes bacterium]
MTLQKFDLRGKVAVITGGNGGIGLGCAMGLAKAGAEIMIWARNEAKNESATSLLRSLGVGAHAIAVDVTDSNAVNMAVQETVTALGGIDIFIANAGTNIRKRPEVLTVPEWDQVMEVNVTSVFQACKAIYPEMKARGGGKIIVISSLSGTLGFGISPAYAASKAAVDNLAKSLAVAWGPDNIQVNSILPGWTITDMTVQTRTIPSINEQILQRTPAGRWGTPDDYEGVAAFLASSASDYVTGISIPIDGGFSNTLMIVQAPTQ